MYTVTIWDNTSENYDQTPWHRENGTMTVTVKTQKEAFILNEIYLGDQNVIRATITEPNGYTRMWNRQTNEGV